MKLPKITAALWMWIASLAAVGVAVLWLIWPRAAVIEAAAIDRGEVRRELEEEGRVHIRDVYTVTAPITGLLRRVELRAGDAVSAGDPVATISPVTPALLDARSEREANAAIAAARSALALAEADANLARVEQQRTAALFERGFASKAARDLAQTKLDASTAVVNQRKADLQRALAAISRPASRSKEVVVRSPSSGRVLQVLQESETVLAPGTPLLEIGDPAKIEVVAEYLSQDAAWMREGACAFIDIPGAEPIPARVEVIEPYARTKVSALGVEEQRVNVVLSVDDAEAAAMSLGHGYRVDVRVVVFEAKDVLRVPTDALVRKGDGGWAVFRIRNGRATLTSVTVGDGDDRFRTVIDGVSEGERVILFPSDVLRDGEAVRARQAG